MKKIAVLFGVLFCVSYHVQSKSANTITSDSIKSIQQKNVELSKDISELRKEIEYTKTLVQVGNGTISNQLSSSQNNLNTINNLFAFISIILIIVIPAASWYITRLSQKATNSVSQADAILIKINEVRSEVQAMQKDVAETQNTIRNNLSALYQSLKDEELKAIFNRLESEPLDVTHFFPILATMKLSPIYYESLTKIYDAIKDENARLKATVLILICTQFPSKIFKSKKIINELNKYSVSQGFYPNELLPFLDEMGVFFRENNFQENISLAKLTIQGAAISTEPITSSNLCLNFFNKQLNAEQKELLINSLKNGVIEMSPMLGNWEAILKAE